MFLFLLAVLADSQSTTMVFLLLEIEFAICNYVSTWEKYPLVS